MLKMNKKDGRSNLEKEIDKVLVQIDKLRNSFDEIDFDKDDSNGRTYVDERYAQLILQLEKLYKMREIEKRNELNPNTILTVGGSFASILGILLFEKTDILRTKALGFVIRGRV